jgi:ribose 5-phosphate isomerase RpiB
MSREYVFFISIERFEKATREIIASLSQMPEVEQKFEPVYALDNPEISKRYDIKKLTGNDTADIAARLVKATEYRAVLLTASGASPVARCARLSPRNTRAAVAFSPDQACDLRIRFGANVISLAADYIGQAEMLDTIAAYLVTDIGMTKEEWNKRIIEKNLRNENLQKKRFLTSS